MKRDLLPVARALKRNLRAGIWNDVPDPRDRRGVRHPLASLLSVLTLGMIANMPTLRDLERLVQRLTARGALGIQGTPSDTTLYNLARQLEPTHLRPVVVDQVKAMERNKQLEQAIDFPFSLVAVDGKALGTDPEQVHPESHRTKANGTYCYVLKALRAVHVSSAVKPVLDQRLIPKGKGERHDLWSFLVGLRQSYGRLVGCLSFDAGFWSENLVMSLDSCFWPYIIALKGNAGAAHRYALRALGEGQAEPPMGWELETRETRNGQVIVRQLARIHDDLGTCGAVTCAWRQRTQVFRGDKQVSEDNRYFATNLSLEQVTARQALAAIRAHWGIENDSNWTMDAILKEDSTAWVAQERGREVLTWLRILAYNLLRLLRCRTLRAARRATLPWRAVVEEVRDALLRPDLWRSGFS